LANSEDAHLLIQEEGSVLVLTLNRPESLNAFSHSMIQGLTDTFRSARTREDVRAVVLLGAGRAFSAGGDVKTMGAGSPFEAYDHIGGLNDCILAMRDLEKPIIAGVHGFAAGAGFNLAMACDLIVASEETRFILSFAKVGLISDGGGSYFLPRIVSPQIAKELFFLAEPISAARAYELGIVNRVVPVDQMHSETYELAFRLANGPIRAYGAMKRMIDEAPTRTLAQTLQAERTIQAAMVTTADHKEGVLAFKEKRIPNFQGK
jgi:2-(1,2-epoxy-1,2-dihydrophenyl)acetyl-CoA isomerase